ncbi:YchJ family metal-binding protein [Allokutzneria sp. A3M-2-11 16]|uniref:YchJ family protein n=1 Tax=Allokutzneria sp. A3M-2-11 16 TaxID=2962043 RepID=UPI0020B63A87|nr:YchJ family metal-binding protein [Allokutzneria sp. A3M-2-11 16]MCP3804279.1 YchJ family metal-binding protein [Allokutzneria sp. A3M-2-11 16]
MTCPCGLDKSYDQCCGALHSGAAAASTAVQLMRSRYSAFAVSDEAYLLRTWHPDTRPSTVDFEPRQKWTGLEILSTAGGGVFHTEGTVEFVASYRVRGRAGELRENSDFVRRDGLWVYVRGTVH